MLKLFKQYIYMGALQFIWHCYWRSW